MENYELKREIYLTDGYVIKEYQPNSSNSSNSAKIIWKLHIKSFDGEKIFHPVKHRSLVSVLVDYICWQTFNKRFEPAIRKL